ncbi:HupE/UreJ family protein [Bradyrhizobium sp. CB1650]|uniref:HupE/UreJ family protein n=1 Tax=Bradyrhizobium sp. CB1650 TaxID=3039153 RepID=UPI00243552A0|nr:HupE/UreJ family protein [Bradyrhizobium sp. CB1650]WGD50712.1 HupE/UreJ family protein [Bradyrhizobium sp. CB1650]
MSWPRLVLLGMILLGLGGPACAHQVNLSTARVALAADRTVTVEVALKGSDVDRLAGTKIYDAKEDAVDPAAVDAAAASILAYLQAHLAVRGADATACAAGTAAILADGDGVIYRNSFACANVAGDIVYRSTVLTEKDPTARQVVLVAQGKSEAQALLDAGNTTVTLSAPAPPLWSTMQRYLLTGIEHIFLGYDHIAFLIAVVLWARRLIPVIKIVTAFTIAHSITLSLAALDLVVIPSRIVEPAIAASIVFVAVENFFSRDIDRRWRVTFMFGLIHGFGFAGALREVGLPTNAIVPALAAFNIGVEIGQVAIVAIVMPLLGLFDRLIATDPAKPVRAARLVYAVSAAISLLGGYWLFTRVFEA